MTPKQQAKFYFPHWNAAARAHGWTMRAGRLQTQRDDAFGAAGTDQLYHAVWDAAEARADQHHRAVIPDDLRHACHVVALGEDKPSGALTNKEVDRVVCLFRILADPENLDALIEWAAPAESERKRLVYAITQLADPPYIDHLCRCRTDWRPYTSPFWEDLPLPALRQLAMTLRARVGQTSGLPVKGVSDPVSVPETPSCEMHDQPF